MISRIYFKWLAILYFSLAGAFLCNAEKKIIDQLPYRSARVENFNRENLICELNELDLHHIEGVWLFPSIGSEVAIVRVNRDSKIKSFGFDVYEMILVSSINRALHPGTVVGLITPTGKPKEYDAKIYTKTIGTTFTIPANFTLNIDTSTATISFKRQKRNWILNATAFIPYVWRHAIRYREETKTSNSCVRIFPNPPLPSNPIYF